MKSDAELVAEAVKPLLLGKSRCNAEASKANLERP